MPFTYDTFDLGHAVQCLADVFDESYLTSDLVRECTDSIVVVCCELLHTIIQVLRLLAVRNCRIARDHGEAMEPGTGWHVLVLVL